MKTNIENVKPLPNRCSGVSADRRQLKNRIIAALCRDAATKPVGPSMFNVQCWLFNVAVFAIASSALADVHYVDVNGTNATPPYTNWTTAATDIQSAVDAAVASEEIVVTNGIYNTGGRSVGYTTNRVAIDKSVTVRSVNGPQLTIIDGSYSVRCAYLTNGASLSGFTLTNGFTDFYSAAHNGAGVFCESVTAVVSNCVITGNRISGPIDYQYGAGGWADGGGTNGGTLNNCTLTGNSVIVEEDLGYYSGWEVDGGGAAYCTLNNCALEGNSATVSLNQGSYADAAGGGAYSCTLNNCTLTDNLVTAFNLYYFGVSDAEGGGANFCTLNNCTLTGNSAYDGGGGAAGCTLNNCIVYFNTDGHNHVNNFTGHFESTLNHCWTADPQFVDTNGWANLRLQPNSPCINAGNNSYVTGATDLDGNPRISGGTVDIGAYEYQWPQLTLTPSDTNVVLSWPTNNVGYDYTGFTVQSTTNLVSPAVWTTNSSMPVVINGQNVVSNPITGNWMFYRLGQ
jgi:hypothetical protein